MDLPGALFSLGIHLRVSQEGDRPGPEGEAKDGKRRCGEEANN